MPFLLQGMYQLSAINKQQKHTQFYFYKKSEL